VGRDTHTYACPYGYLLPFLQLVNMEGAPQVAGERRSGCG